MSSSIDTLFGAVDSNKIESSVSKLFSGSSGPIDNLQVKSRKRTVLPPVIRAEETQVQSESESSKEDEENVPAQKKQKKSKKNDDDEDLEGRYYAKLIDNDDKEDSELKDEDFKKASAPAVNQVAKKVDLKDDELEKADRTIFVGNITNTAITSKLIYKEFKKLFSMDLTKKDNDEEEDDEEEKIKENKFAIESIRFRSISFDEALPRKVAFVQQKLHKSRESVNAYIIFKNKSVIKSVAAKLNGTLFHDHHLRVDLVSHPAPHDNKRSVFVGNLDFEEDEENLWNHFGSCGDIEYVRIIRDPKTNLGKGFAYVQFKDFQSVNKALLLNDKQMIKKNQAEKKGRKLRISRCKNMKKVQNGSGKDRSGRLSESQKTKFGRAKKVLGKADRATVGQEITVEGLRANKGEGASHLKKKKQRSKTGRVTQRSQAFKKLQVTDN